MIDRDLLQLQAVKTGLGIKYLSKEERISILLQQLHTIFSENEIVLKGGTALNRGYLYKTGKGRFSEDIDLDYHKSISIHKKIQNITNYMEQIQEFNISSPRLHHRTLRFDCQYTNQYDEKDRVQVEFYLSRKTIDYTPQKILLQSPYLPIAATNFTVYILEELIAQKLISLYRRIEGKDIYDLFYALDLTYDKNKVIHSVSTLFKQYHIKHTIHDFLTNLLEKIDDMESNAYYIGNSTNHFIPKTLRPNWKIVIRDLKQKIDHHFS